MVKKIPNFAWKKSRILKGKSDFQLIRTLVLKEILMEWRQKYAFNGMLLYVISTVFIVYLSFEKIQVTQWTSLFWIIILFASVSAVAKSFMQEPASRMFYYYSIASPRHFLLAKFIYNTLLLIILSFITWLVFILLLTNPVLNTGYWLLVMLLGSLSFSFTLTMVSAIASKARNNATLMTVLSFPVVLPQLALLMALSKRAVSGMSLETGVNDLVTLIAVDAIVLVVSYLLFPYLWRD